MVGEAVEFIRTRTTSEPEIGIILGTGLGGLVREIEVETVIDYAEIPHFPLSTVESHHGRLIFGTLAGAAVVAMQGRFHYYEGYSMKQITFPVRVMAKGPGLGVKTLLISNAAGGMNPDFRRGDLMIIADHINLLGANPLIGPNDTDLGPRFPDMSEPYDRELIALARAIAMEKSLPVRTGVFVAVPGPNLETRAEYRFLRTIGADAVGMSTVPETIAAVHMGLKVLGVSIITDECIPETLQPVDVEEIIRVAGEAEPDLTALFSEVVARLGRPGGPGGLELSGR
ncbi:MAG TPA: purine-nucleoside phosphorylase [Bacteroidota bacterium]|nr:purine-nucleoside phosphorylase [Bacteroidota bacterium]